MFSVIIPLYNKAAYIEKAIRSVLGQTYREFELIIVDDGSTDDPLPPKGGSGADRLKDFSLHSGKIQIFEQVNQGVSTARNNGVKLAKYDYIAFLDADDWWEPTYLEEMRNLIEEFPEAGIYGSSYYLVKNEKKRKAPIGVNPSFTSGIINYFQVYAKTLCMPLWTGATIIKRKIFELENGFKPMLKLGEDFDLWMRIALKHPVALLNKPLSNYNQDVELVNRAVGIKLYEPQQHVLFFDYHEFKENQDFHILHEKLAVYGLLPYYLEGKNKKEVRDILSTIRWQNHEFKYRLYYTILPKFVVSYWFEGLKLGVEIKKKLIVFTKINQPTSP